MKGTFFTRPSQIQIHAGQDPAQQQLTDQLRKCCNLAQLESQQGNNQMLANNKCLIENAATAVKAPQINN